MHYNMHTLPYSTYTHSQSYNIIAKWCHECKSCGNSLPPTSPFLGVAVPTPHTSGCLPIQKYPPVSSPIASWRHGYRRTSHVLWRTPQRLRSSHLDFQSPIHYLGVHIPFEGARVSRHNISQAYILFDLKYIWQTLEMTSRTQSHPQILLISIPWVTSPEHNILIKYSNKIHNFVHLRIILPLHNIKTSNTIFHN